MPYSRLRPAQLWRPGPSWWTCFTLVFVQAPTFGIKDSRSILEQRQSLPIYKLKDQLVQACIDNQVRHFFLQIRRST